MSPLLQIAEQLACFDAKPIDLGELRPAAVLVPLFLRDGEPWVLFTLRPEHLEKHAGEISFPGGSAEDEDRDFWQTALRETEEEVGIRGADVQRLGRLDDFYSVHGYRVKVCVGSFPSDYPYRLDSNEIDEIIELPLARLRDPQIYHQEDWTHKGRMFPVDFYHLDGHNIWGMTAAVLKQLLARTEAVAAQPPVVQALS
ncbi:8-oxo-dGTP pyrophosphatase MutT, NUDIX family [Malonomonas rubra DSM 5091]|uniref:8-oxo-dGTP pyrophosphatase MutT, NUDIX family n=1 Tax=Malonomonas rubra DSM 5091 TaxID=1122189 RepID=A0A1M6HMN2_MALRU|nr:CoA pyrophosphatase [Malonomonas rubra]SHJ23374.1 8-oxo-dGTP pyrophosphatase MutT, NUDIX family [Malonomonas rubra DSM 5091]